MKYYSFCFTALLLFVVALGAKAQLKDPSTIRMDEKPEATLMAYKMPVEVKKFREWAPEYLTISNNWNGMFAKVQSGELPPCLSVVLEINGQSTKEMSVNRFYEILCSSNECSLRYLHKEKGKNEDKTVVFRFNSRYYIPDLQKVGTNDTPSTITLLSDSEKDFFQYNTFSYEVGKDDALTDKNIFQDLQWVLESRGLKYVKENADIVLSLKKSLSQTATSTYVPEQTHVVNTGSTTSVQKNIFTGKNYLSTVQHTETFKTGGYTHTDVAATFKMVITIKDQTKEVEGEHPVIWQLDYNKFSQKVVNTMDEVNNGVAYWLMNYPFGVPMFSYSVCTRGLVFEGVEAIPQGKLLDVLPGTDAYNKGLRAGYQCERGYIGGGTWVVLSWQRANFFKPNKGNKRFYGGNFWSYCIPCGPSYNPINKQYTWWAVTESTIHGLAFGKPHFIFKDPAGKKHTIDKGFEESQFSFEYIP